MEKLLCTIVNGLVIDKDSVSVVKQAKEDGSTVYHLHVAQEDMGRIIGKQGRIAKAIRTVMKTAGIKTGETVFVEID